MGGGLMELVAKGAQDIFLTGNPKVTYFKSIYKRHTNFSIETIEQTFTGVLDFNQKRIVSTINRQGDLLAGITIEIDLPIMEGKNSTNTNSLYWVRSIGNYIIDNVQLEIGGQIIDTVYGEWMEIWNELTLPSSKQNGYNEMIGKDLISTKEHTLIIPLQFWFCRNIGSALPLVALQYHEVKIYLNLRSFQECWRKSLKKFTVTSTNTNPGTFSIAGTEDITTNYIGGKFVFENDETEYEIASTDSTAETITLTSSIPSSVSSKTAYIIENQPKQDYSLKDVRIYCDYIFLDTNERKFFAQNKHVYLIEQLQYNGISSYESTQGNIKIPLEFNHPCKELFWVNQRNFIKSLNGGFHYSKNPEIESSLVANEPIIKDSLLFINGQERFEIRKENHFRLEIPYKVHTRIPDNFIYVYSFCLKPEQNQPSGSCNFSRLDSSELVINYEAGISNSITRIYALNYNILNIKNGMGGLAYSN